MKKGRKKCRGKQMAEKKNIDIMESEMRVRNE